jgi:hypothetical protein
MLIAFSAQVVPNGCAVDARLESGHRPTLLIFCLAALSFLAY